MWLAKARLLAPKWFGRGTARKYLARKLRDPELVKASQGELAELAPYERFGELWHEYSCPYTPNYAAFLVAMARRRNMPLQSVLDLACGSGTVTEKLAKVVPEVTGLDSNEAMLAQARDRCSAFPGVRFVAGDFREFHLGQHFDAIVCASDSLNYVHDVNELGKVFHCVAAHLQPGGLFVFDTLTEKGLRMLSGYYLHVKLGEKKFAISFNYDPISHRERSVVYFPAGKEVHWRMPINPKDVEGAARANGLVVKDYFSFASIPGRWYIGTSCFYVLGN